MVNPLRASSDTKNETDFEEYSDDDDEAWVISDIKDSVDTNGRLIDQHPAYDKIMNAKVALQLYEEVVTGQVKQQALWTQWQIVGRYDAKPMLKSIIYVVEWPDGQLKDYVANVITGNMLSHVDDKGYSANIVD